jgi:hypothetical protein
VISVRGFPGIVVPHLFFATVTRSLRRVQRFGLRLQPRYPRAMCGRARLSSDVSKINLVLSIPPHRPPPNLAPSWSVVRRDRLPKMMQTSVL